MKAFRWINTLRRRTPENLPGSHRRAYSLQPADPDHWLPQSLKRREAGTWLRTRKQTP